MDEVMARKRQDAGDGDVLGAVREIASLINASNDYGALLDLIVNTVCRRLKWSRCGILVIDRSEAQSRSVAFCDLHFEKSADEVMSWDLATSPTLQVLETRSPLVIPDAPNNKRFPKFREFAEQYGLETVVYLPLSSTDLDGREMILSVGFRDAPAVSEDDLEVLRTICHLISIAVEKFKLFRAEQRVNESLRELFDNNARLLERIIAGCTLEEAVGLIAIRLKQPFAVYDRVSDACHWSGPPDALAKLKEPEQDAAMTALGVEIGSVLNRDSGGRRGGSMQLPVTAGGKERNIEAIVNPLRVNDHILGGLVVFPQAGGMTDIERLMTQGAQFAVSTHLMRTYANWMEQNTVVAAFFGQLFDGDWENIHQIETMADSAGVDFAASAQFLAVDLSAVSQESAVIQSSIEMTTRQILPSAVVFINNHVLFIYHPALKGDSIKVFERLAKEIGSQIEWRAGISVAMTISPVCSEPSDYRSVRSGCMQVLRLARLFGRSGLVGGEDFGSFAVLVSAFGDDAVTRFHEKTLQPLIDHDRAKKGSLLRCSEAFLREGCRYQAAADVLDIHVSTLRYRLKRLKDLFGLDLENNEDDRFTLSLALRIHQLRS